jgi:hypothetical protein
MAKRSLALLLICLGALAALPVMAQADTQNIIEPQGQTPESKNGFQAGTCYSDTPFCTSESPDEQLFTQAGGHPPIGFTQYIIQHDVVVPGVVEPVKTDPEDVPPYKDKTIKTLRVDLPPGLTVNPQATEKCSKEAFETIVEVESKPLHIPQCPKGSIVGREEVTLVVNTANAVPNPLEPGKFLPVGFVVAPDPAKGTKVPVYNIEPDEGEPARFGFVIAFQKVVYLETEVAWENDFHESFTIPLPEPSAPFSTLKSRLVNFGQDAGNIEASAGNGTYISLPTTCYNPTEWPTLYSTWFRAESWGEPNPTFPEGSTAFEAKLPPGTQPTGCDNVPFDIAVNVDPGTNQVDSPAAATIETTLPFDPAKEGGEVRNEGTEGIMQSHVRKAELTMPKGMGLNPSGAQGLVACKDSEFKKGVRVYDNDCPAASDIGTVEVKSAPLAEPLIGDVYVGEQKSNDPESGEQFRILLEAKSEKEGIAARLIGHVKANNTTGELTAVITDQLSGQFSGKLPEGLPQVPFESVKVKFDGDKAVLTSPPICTASGTSHFEPWARPGESKPATASVTLTSDPTGGACPATLAERRFAPSYFANVNDNQGGAFSPLHVHIARKDGEQELKVVDVTLPKGLTGKLAGIPYCPEDAIAAAAGKSGKAEQASPSCPSSSQIGNVTTKSGSGANPLQLGGSAYLAGPYKGAALSMVTITPAVAGPFDLGTVVVRVALNVDPETAQIHAVSDVIPDVFGGVKLDIRAIDLDLDRSQFMLNPTNCYYQETTGAINGGGADPANPAAFSSWPVYDPFQSVGCGKLGFKPNLKVQLFGPTTRAKNPRLKATLTARKGDANVGRVALRLPKALFLEQSHIGTVCTRPQLASHTCPKASVYGKAWAQTPLLDKKLQGKVYLVSSDNELPDLLVDLRGQVEIYLRGVISGKGGGLKTVFHEAPDVPVSKFVLNMKGGKKSLLVNSENICKKKQRAFLNMRGWNNKKIKTNKFKLNITSCGKKKGKK